MLPAGANVVWRCHVGLDVPNDAVHAAWDFLEPYVRDAHAYVFSRATYAWTGLDPERVTIIRPSIDVFSPKNQELAEENVRAILQVTGLIPDGHRREATFTRNDGSPGRVDRAARLVEDDARSRRAAPSSARSRAGTTSRTRSASSTASACTCRATRTRTCCLPGPTWRPWPTTRRAWRSSSTVCAHRAALPDAARARVHLASLPMVDPEENAAIVNAIQRHATIMVQKSLAEGFGLTVAEAMWKHRPVVASRIGGIQEQVIDGESGLLVDDPHDLAAFGAALGTPARRPGTRAAARRGRPRTGARGVPRAAPPRAVRTPHRAARESHGLTGGVPAPGSVVAADVTARPRT